MSVWQTIIASLGGGSMLVLMVGWLARSIILHMLNKDVENHKLQLKHEADIQIERVKHEFQLKSAEHRIRFADFHGKRAEVISGLYEHVVRAHRAVKYFVTPLRALGAPETSQRVASANKELGELYTFFEEKQIYLPEQFCVGFEEFFDAIRSCAIALGNSRDEDGEIRDSKKWFGVFERLSNEAPSLRTALERELRSLLGDMPIGEAKADE